MRDEFLQKVAALVKTLYDEDPQFRELLRSEPPEAVAAMVAGILKRAARDDRR